jgi:predicted metallopeptidase
MRDLSTRSPEFSHLVPARVLVVAGEARRASRGSVKPLAFARAKSRDHSGVRKPVVRVEGRRMLYCVTLRPLFFRDSRPEQRVETLLHELYHVSRAFDGTLDPTRRHARLGRKFSRKFRPLVRRYLRDCPPDVLAPFAHHGPVRVLAWLERPPATHARGRSRRVYTEEQLYTVTVHMLTRAKHRAPPPADGH